MKTHPISPKLSRRSGFTLLEMVIVLGIISMIMGGAIYMMKGIKNQAKPQQARADINAFLSALELYKINKGSYPSTQEGLESLVRSKSMTRVVKDPWSRPYIYRFPGKINNSEPEILSTGEDGQEGNEDDVNSQTM